MKWKIVSVRIQEESFFTDESEKCVSKKGEKEKFTDGFEERGVKNDDK